MSIYQAQNTSNRSQKSLTSTKSAADHRSLIHDGTKPCGQSQATVVLFTLSSQFAHCLAGSNRLDEFLSRGSTGGAPDQQKPWSHSLPCSYRTEITRITPLRYTHKQTLCTWRFGPRSCSIRIWGYVSKALAPVYVSGWPVSEKRSTIYRKSHQNEKLRPGRQSMLINRHRVHF